MVKGSGVSVHESVTSPARTVAATARTRRRIHGVVGIIIINNKG